MILFYDTETTGFPKDGAHIVQIAAQLCENDGTVISQIDVICEPPESGIPDVVSKIHGITTEKAALVGINEGVAVSMLTWLGSKADLIVGHNVSFDDQMVEIAATRYKLTKYDEFKSKKRACTGAITTPICKMPPSERMVASGRTGFKMPKLSEAYQFFIGRDLVGAHGAMADCNACREIYYCVTKLPN